MFDKDAEEIAYKSLCRETICINHCHYNSPKHHRCGEWHRCYESAKEGIELGYNEGYHDAEEHYLTVIDSQHKLVDESRKKAIKLLFENGNLFFEDYEGKISPITCYKIKEGKIIFKE